MIAYLNPTFLPTPLLAEQFLRQSLLHVRRNEDASFAMIRMGSTVDADTRPTGYLIQNRQQPFELWTHRNRIMVRERRNEVIRIFHRITYRCQHFLKSRLPCLVQSSTHGLPIRRHSNQFVVTHVECVIMYRQKPIFFNSSDFFF